MVFCHIFMKCQKYVTALINECWFKILSVSDDYICDGLNKQGENFKHHENSKSKEMTK